MFVRIFLLLLLLVLAPPLRAADLVLVLSERGGVYADFARTLNSMLDGSSWRVVATVTPDALAGDDKLQAVPLWLTVGSEATRQGLAQARQSAVFATLLPRHAFDRLLAEAPQRPRGGVQALVLDQPLERQLRLIERVFGGRKKIGVLYGPESRPRMARAQQTIAARGFTIETEEAENDSDVVRAANRLFARADVVLALPDNLVYGRANVPAVLLASFRHRRPVVAYSAGLVTAGATVGVFSTPAQLARQAGEYLTSGRKSTAAIIYPEIFSLAWNRQVAESLGVPLPEEREVMQLLQAGRAES